MLNKNHLNPKSPLLEIKSLKKYFPVKKGLFAKISGWVKAVDNVSFSISEGETFGLVGESGCGKSTIAKLILQIESTTNGSICFEGKDINKFTKNEQQVYRESVQPVLQNPASSLSPRLRVGSIIREPLAVGSRFNKQQINIRIAEALEAVGLRSEDAQLFPHEFSGGQKQRIAIARALSTHPKLIILDEPISSLDVSIRAQVMNLLLRVQDEFGLAFMLIAHDLAVVLHISSKVGVMYVGKMVETAKSADLYQNPLHPYTKALFTASFQHFKDSATENIMVQGEVASPLRPPAGCRFHPRCPEAAPICKEVEPNLNEISKEHKVACHFADI
jgi:oligopeptide/dipeptide ABC transporter ATP-binding protein